MLLPFRGPYGALLHASIASLLLSACGGGSGAGESTPAPITNNTSLTLSPASVTLTLDEGHSSTFVVKATANKDFAGIVNVAIVDPKGVITPDARIYGLDSHTYQAELTTARNLAPGTYDGEIEVRLCKDSPVTCAQPHEGSPWKLPYHFVVRAI